MTTARRGLKVKIELKVKGQCKNACTTAASYMNND